MASNEVVMVGRAQLDQLRKALEDISNAGKQAQTEMGTTGKRIQEQMERTSKRTEATVRGNASILRRLAGQLYSDFKALASIQGLQAGLKLSSQFSGAVAETLTLNDTIRRLGSSFGVAKDKFGDFQAFMAKGLGDIGASSEEAAEALKGLSGLGVKGQESALGLAKGAVTLAGIGGEKGNSQAIARSLGMTLQAMGKNINDASAQQKLIGEVTAAVTTTGKSSSEILGAMEQIASTMDKSMRGKVGPEAMAQMAVLATTVGPSATKAIQEYLSKSTIERQAMEAQGFGKIFDDRGELDIKKLVGFIKEGEKRIGFDPRKALQTFGFSEEAAEGLVKVAEQSDAVQKNLAGLVGATRDNETAFKQTLGILDSFRGAINTVKGNVESAFGGITQTINDLLGAQVGDIKGSTAVVAGGGILAALLAGGGLRGIGKTLGQGAGGFLKKEGYETLTGEEVQSVYVVNAAEIGAAASGGGLLDAVKGKAGMLGKVAGMAGKGLGVAGAGYAGYELGQAIEPGATQLLNQYTTGKTSEGFEGNALERLFFKLDQIIGGDTTRGFQQVKVSVETKTPNLRAKAEKTRGAAQ